MATAASVKRNNCMAGALGVVAGCVIAFLQRIPAQHRGCQPRMVESFDTLPGQLPTNPR